MKRLICGLFEIVESFFFWLFIPFRLLIDMDIWEWIFLISCVLLPLTVMACLLYYGIGIF